MVCNAFEFRIDYLKVIELRSFWGQEGSVRLVSAIVLLSVAAVAPAWPQASTSVVHGSVRDATDAVIPGATVTLTGVETNVERKTTTNSAGLYVFPGAVPGAYRILVEHPGMQR